jgi:hypothetical protein
MPRSKSKDEQIGNSATMRQNCNEISTATEPTIARFDTRQTQKLELKPKPEPEVSWTESTSHTAMLQYTKYKYEQVIVVKQLEGPSTGFHQEMVTVIHSSKTTIWHTGPGLGCSYI